MATALFAFDDQTAAQAAARRVIESGLPREAVHVHVQQPPADANAGVVDELVTGGFVHSFSGLLKGLFEWGDAGAIQPGAAQSGADYQAVIERGGAVVSVEAATDTDRALAEAAVGELRPTRRSEWRTAAAG